MVCKSNFKTGFSWLFSWIFCDFHVTPFKSQCAPYSQFSTKIASYFNLLLQGRMFESFQNFFLAFAGGVILFCFFLPALFCFFFIVVCVALLMIFYCPPLAILTLALPCMKSEEYKTFQLVEKPSAKVHWGSSWYEIGWVRAFIICCILTCCGFFPGVFFAAVVASFHVLLCVVKFSQRA
jgi:hypothetical protein